MPGDIRDGLHVRGFEVRTGSSAISLLDFGELQTSVLPLRLHHTHSQGASLHPWKVIITIRGIKA
jgi:hypothetical protein